ncbi:SRPBCC family protein [Kosakonia sacchari]|uniref:SRPBCC family protein n=1 Tax=Kosakonia sacchari TaxID=1158459 RepID=UPI002ACE4C82|nr:SRPBCC family protein [Kosakonia sacchari]MDZ7321459.1 SRPBCC family protein [Kosakonia sacchari]
MNEDNAWSKRYKLTVGSTPKAIWQAFVDTDNWKRWNPGVKSITIEGPFHTGTWFTMTLPEGEVVRSQLTDVSEEKYFIDETRVDETRVNVEHRIEASGSDESNVIYAISTHGPQAKAFGEGISSDFPEVMAGLARYLAETDSM